MWDDERVTSSRSVVQYMVGNIVFAAFVLPVAVVSFDIITKFHIYTKIDKDCLAHSARAFARAVARNIFCSLLVTQATTGR